MSIYGSAVRKPITTIMIFIAVVVFGGYSLKQLAIDFYPELDFPAISVMTMYEGASASDVETNVTDLIEGNLNTVSDLKEITSVSRDGMSIVVLEFEFGKNLDEATNEIRDALNFIEPFLADEVTKPAIFKFNSSLMPILFYAVTAEESYAALDQIIDEKIINPLNRIEGVGSVGIGGAPGREIQIDIDPRKMEGYNLTVEMVSGVLNAENMNLPAGNIEMGMMDYPIRIQGEFQSSDEIRNIVLANYMGQPIYLRDIATIKDTIRDMTYHETINGKDGVRVVIQKQSGANTVKISEEIKKIMPELIASLPDDVELSLFFDSSEYIRGSINNLSRSLMFAGIFVILVVLFFLGRWRATFIVILTIPISLIVAFIYLFVTDNSINIISLSSLSIAIGMVVDDAIVVLENITKHVERGSRPREAAIYATNEVWLAVIVTTLTVLAVFLPLTMTPGLVGMMFKQLGFVVSITITTSTIAAITLTPMLSSKLLKLRDKAKKRRKLSYANTIEKLLDQLNDFYARTLTAALKIRIPILVGAFVIFVLSLMLVAQIGFVNFPEADEGQFGVTVELATGTRVDEANKVADKVTVFLEENYPEIELLSTSSGADDQGGFTSLFAETGNHIINVSAILVNQLEREKDVWQISEEIREYLATIPEIVSYTVTPNGGSMGGAMMGNQIDVEIYGYDFSQTTLLANQLVDSLETLTGATNITMSRDPSKPELQIKPNREKLALHGLNTFTLANAIRNRIEGPFMRKYREDGNEYDIVIRFDEDDRNSITDIENILVTNQQGESVRVKEIADVVEYWVPPNIEHKRRQRIITVSVTPYMIPLNKLSARIDQVIKHFEIPDGVYVESGGAAEDFAENMADLQLLFLLVVILVYIVMASQFESLLMPFIIMFSIPFAFTGVILAHYFTGTVLSMISLIGGVMLVGIVVKNAIVLVDYINLMRDRGFALTEAIVESGRSRLRPVLMTSVTTILGMLPLALSKGDGSEIWSPMGISVIGGLIFSTFITLVLVPVVYHLFIRKKGKRKQSVDYGFMNGATE
ncbi:MAG: efflux RND transporter permease subunit [Bacteroidales bacterium]|nr:efflux RND transporter permease subunit [Bacteroidales bacterium]MDT8431852.1 efflux RND transporter permease subunit [Bacteroidales bacterium]